MTLVLEYDAVLAVVRLVLVGERSNRITRQQRTVEVEVAIRLVQIDQTAAVRSCIHGIHLQRTLRRNDYGRVVGRSPFIGKTVRSLSCQFGVITAADAFNLTFCTAQGEIGITIVSTLRTVIGGEGNLQALSHKLSQVDSVSCPFLPGKIRLIMPTITLVAGRTSGVEVRTTACCVHFLAVLVLNRQREVRLFAFGVTRVFQYYGIFQHQDGIDAVHVVVICDRFPFIVIFPVTETHCCQLSVRNQRQEVVRPRVISMDVPVDRMTAVHLFGTVVDSSDTCLRRNRKTR